MDTSSHPDPFHDAMQHGLHRAIQVASCAVTAAQVYLYQQRSQARTVAERDEKARRALNAQIRAERDTARAGWAPALDPAWLRSASFTQTAQAWGTAVPYADRAVPWYEPAAATAMRTCEERLRDLHPYAMAYYDRLRDDGMSPAEAMREAAPLFARPSHAYDAPTTERLALTAGNGSPVWAASSPVPGAPAPGVDTEVLERRGRQILGAIQDRAREQGRSPLGEAEQRTVLETVTSLPPEVIDQIVQPGATVSMARTMGDRTVVADRARSQEARTARPWEHDFPFTIREVVAAATRTVSVPVQTPAASRGLSQKQVRHGPRL